MAVPMMRIRRVGMRVRNGTVPVNVGVGLVGWVRRYVGMVVVFVVNMRMRVLDGLMQMFVLVPLAQVHPGSHCHQ
jgi:selenophosphate synthetase-related protein